MEPAPTSSQWDRRITMSAYSKNLIAGGIAGCMGKTATAPLARLTVLYQVSTLLSKSRDPTIFKISRADGVFVSMRKLVEKNGVLSLWNGNMAAVMHRFPYSATNFAVFEACNRYLRERTGQDSSLNRFISGSAAGSIACAFCYPLDLLRTRLIVANSYAAGEQVGSKLYNLVRQIVRNEGVAGLYRGLSASLLVTTPTLAISFTCYGSIKQQLTNYGGFFATVDAEGGEGQAKLSLFGSLCAGCLSGSVAATTVYPMDVVRKRMQVMGQLSYTDTGALGTDAADEAAEQAMRRMQSSTLHHLKTILRTEGVAGMYRGLTPELLKVCPMVALMYGSYEIVQQNLDAFFPTSSNH
jgi:solute carrier family 25 phosphate transporter 23/24/25/41